MNDVTTLGTCAGDCGRTLVSGHQWGAMPHDERKRRSTELGQVRSSGRGLCWRCRKRATRAGTLIDHERLTVPRAVVLEEWAHMDRRPEDSYMESIRQLAPRLGMRPEALRLALGRARQDGVAA